MVKIHEQITKETWTKYRLHNGDQYCLVGWLCRDGRLRCPARDVMTAILTLYPERKAYDLLSFNDHPDTTFDDVLRVLKVADV